MEKLRMVQLEKRPFFGILRSESSFDVFMRVVALGKSFPTHGHMRQSDERGLGKVHFTNRAGSWTVYSRSRNFLDIEENQLDICSRSRARAPVQLETKTQLDIEESCRCRGNMSSNSSVRDRGEVRKRRKILASQDSSNSIKIYQRPKTLDIILVYLFYFIHVLSLCY